MQNTFSQSGNDSKWFLKKSFFKIGKWQTRPPRDPHPFMANAILNFHFDYLTTSLIKSLSILRTNTRPKNSLTQILFSVFEIISALLVVLTMIKLAIGMFALCQLFVMTMIERLLLPFIKVSTALFVMCCLLEIWQG